MKTAIALAVTFLVNPVTWLAWATRNDAGSRLFDFSRPLDPYGALPPNDPVRLTNNRPFIIRKKHR